MKNPTGFRSCLRRLADARLLFLVLATFALATARGATVTAFDPATWPRTDAAIGVTGFTIEDFEDTTLVSGLQVRLSGGTADYGPTGTLPHAFDPDADDPNGANVLVPGIWDGTHVLMNRRNAPLPGGYVDGEWADTTFVFTRGATSIGFSVQQLESPNTMMTVVTNLGTTSVNLSTLANFSVGSTRNGYLRIEAAAGEVISSVKIDNLGGDGMAFDHLAFSAPAVFAAVTAFDPSTWPRTDQALGISGFLIEDFEDTTLVPGLTVQLSGGSNDFGPTTTLPHAFDPNADDPNVGKVLANGVWDGTHALLNRRTAPLPTNYLDNEWADITFAFGGGATSVGFSVQQLQAADTPMTVTTTFGTNVFDLSTLAGFTSTGRNGYLRIDAAPGALILSVKIDNQPLTGVNDGFALDHLAFQTVPRPVAHWKFDEAGGTTAEDSAGSFDGTLSATGSSLGAAGISGNAVSLDRAAGGFVNMGTSFPGFTSGDFTVVAWVKTTTTEVDTLVVGKHEAFVTNGYLLPINPTGGGGAANKATFYASDVQVAQSPVSTTTVNDGNWHQLVGVYRAGAMHSIYVDGSPAEASTASQAIVANSAPFLVGGVNVTGSPQPRYTGLVDDVQVYDFALTDAQIGFLFGHPGLEAPDINRLLFRDDFNGSIDPAWMIARPDAAYQTINPTELDLRASSGDLFAANNNAKNVFVVPNPTSGDFTITARLNSFAPPNTNNSQFDLLAFDDDDNHVRANYGFINGQYQIEFGKEVAQNPSFQGTPLNLGSGAYFLRLTKVGTTYTQSYSTDGVSFTTVNAPLTYGDGTPTKLGFVVDTDPSESSHAFIDFFAIETLVPPEATTGTAANIATTSATLNGTVNPNGATTSYYFEYGPDTNYGSVTATQSAGNRPNAVPVSAAIGGLAPNTTYHFRLVATSSGATVTGLDAMFTTALPPPTVTTGAATDVRVHRATLNGTLDPNGVATSYYFEYGETTSYGSVTPTVNAGMTAGPVSATITGLDGAATVHFRLVGQRGAMTFPGSNATFTTLTPGITAVAARDTFAPDANGDPTTATFFSFGPPAIGDAGHLAFRATLTKGDGDVTPSIDTGIWAESNGGLRLIAQEGGVAPDTLANFASFGDPVFASGDHVAFLAKLKPGTGDATAANASGIWSDVSGTLKLIARQGAPAPGAGSATFASFTSVGLPDVGGPVFIAKLKGATPTTDVGLWGANAAGVVQPVLVREGGQLDVGGGVMKTVATLQFLPVMKIVNGQTRGFNSAGALTFRATFTDKSFAIYRIVGGVVTLLAAKGGDAPPASATFATIGQPAISDANDAAFLGTMTIGAGGVTTADDAAIFASIGGVAPEVIAREGEPAPTLTADFASFSNPVANAAGEVAFLAKLKPGTGDATPANASAIFAHVGGTLTLVARQGGPAPDGVNVFSKFSAFALPDFGGPVFLGKLKRSRTVTAKNDSGIWAADDANALSLVVRTGSQLTAGGEQKTVRLLQFLPAVRGVPGQTRGFNRDGYLTFRAVFTDRTEAIFRVLR